MTFFIKLENGSPASAPLSIHQVAEDLPMVVGVVVTPELVEPHGYGVFEFTPPPPIERYRKLKQTDPARDASGIWRQQWDSEQMSAEELAVADAAEAFRLRGARARKLFESDWTQLADAPLTADQRAAWSTYRQQLRDIPAQPGFPWEVTWPTAPNFNQ